MASAPISPMMGGGDPTQGAAPAPAPGAPPSAAPANPKMVQLASLYKIVTTMAQGDPVIAAGLSKAAEGIQEAQSALVTQPQPQPIGMTPPY